MWTTWNKCSLAGRFLEHLIGFSIYNRHGKQILVKSLKFAIFESIQSEGKVSSCMIQPSDLIISPFIEKATQPWSGQKNKKYRRKVQKTGESKETEGSSKKVSKESVHETERCPDFWMLDLFSLSAIPDHHWANPLSLHLTYLASTPAERECLSEASTILLKYNTSNPGNRL